MKFSPRKLVIWVAAAIILAVFFVQPGTQQSKYITQIETVSKVCTFDEYPQQDVRSVGNSIVVTMPVQTPTSCYDVTGTTNFYGNDITVNLKAALTNGTCSSQCVGVIVSRITLSNLDRGDYSVHVNAPDRSLTFSNVKVGQ